jgi:hypothetical protein
MMEAINRSSLELRRLNVLRAACVNQIEAGCTFSAGTVVAAAYRSSTQASCMDWEKTYGY